MKPMLFNTEMVRAILDGRKTVTRRVVKPVALGMTYENGAPARKQPYQPGDILYVRETWCNINKPGIEPDYYYLADTKDWEDYDPSEWTWGPSIHMPKEAARLFLRVTGIEAQRVQDITDEQARREGSTDRVDFRRVWNDCYAKPRPVKDEDGKICHYVSYPWENIQETRTYRGKPWYVDANPWVWVVAFEPITREEALEREEEAGA